MGAIMVSGATGFLGSAIIERLVTTTDEVIYALVRGRNGRTPSQRLESLWWERPVLREALGGRIVPVEGDIERENLGLEQERYDQLAAEVSIVFHTAAEVGINQTRQRFWDANVVGTANMLEFAKRANALGTGWPVGGSPLASGVGGLQRFVHISTAYVAGRREGAIAEELFAEGDFNSLYEWSKHEAELLVAAYGDEVPYTIVRPSQIVGDSQTGFITTFNTLYYPLKLYMRGQLRAMPASRDLRVNMVPVDYVAKLACKAAMDDRARGRVLHAVAPAHDMPLLGDLVQQVREWSSEHLLVDLPAPSYVPIAGLASAGRARNLREDSGPKRKSLMRNLAALAPYFYEKREFQTDCAQAIAGEPFPDWREYLPRLLEYAVRRNFLNYTERTVYEQMLVRLKPGARTHIDYFDVGSQGVVKHDGVEMREEILAIARALMAHGVSQGDRIATIGLNSVRYFALDAAIGLVGAVNVPLYYTSPVGDVRELVAQADASLLFVGTERMLAALQAGSLPVPIVCMLDEADEFGEKEATGQPSGQHVAGGSVGWRAAGTVAGERAVASAGEQAVASTAPATVTSWRDFLALADNAQVAELSWVAPEQMATIRFTSGTTGMPKGVVFDQGQVRWMGETMTSVLDWKTRNAKKLRYLSFLPMSHVVEGILVAYAPYYILSDIEMYYLNDFPSLADVLPKVRPNLFFSVPRFYEKVWNQFAATGAGKYWISLPDGPAKRALARPLRLALLRKAGLDQCRQLIVGSAPINEELLESFRSLGVEIHNAFGVTEAPLITLSRLGENELGSVGQLLPETEARIDGEGQVHVRGPQVTRRYYGHDEPAVDDEGWFCTGDLATWSAEGNLVLRGRKKEILVTSYGKNIAPQKIEVLLKGIDGVSEAMVVADARPFTTALIWLEDDGEFGAGDFAALDAAVCAMNEELSHPEQVKRWIVAQRPLSVQAGELTPNLKVRRNIVAETRADLVDLLYEGWDAQGGPGDDVMHRGQA